MSESAAVPKLSRYGNLNTWDIMKLLALLLMLIDHAGYFFYPGHLLLRAFGRGAAPIFLFLTGFAPSHRLRPGLLACAISMVLFNLAAGGGVFPLGILSTIVLGRLMVALMDSKFPPQQPQEWLVVLGLFALPTSFLFENGTLGLMFVLCGYTQRHADRYPAAMRLRMLLSTFFFLGLLHKVLFNMPLGDTLVMIAVLAGVAAMLWHLRVRPVMLPAWLKWSEPGLRLLSRYTLWIYALHYGGLQLLTGKHY